MLIAVMTCHATPKSAVPMPDRVQIDHTLRHPAIRETWANEETKFFFGRGSHNPTASDEIVLACGDSYYETAFKVQAICRWALQHGHKDLFKADDDTYLRPERLNAAGYEAYDFVCRLLPATDENHPVPYPYGGCGYYLGERMLNLAAEDRLPTSDPEGDTWGRCNTYEDGWIGRVAQDAGVMLTDDHRLKHIKPATSEFENYAWQSEFPAATNEMIAVCEFTAETMREAHKIWTGESVLSS